MERESSGRMFTSSSRIIETVTTAENLRRLSQAVELESPILVQGEVGCGKSFLIRELAASRGLESRTRVYLKGLFHSPDNLSL